MARSTPPSNLAGFRPGGVVHGEVRVPSSKSIAQRVLVAAGLTEGPCRVTGLSDAGDVAALAGALRAAGVGIGPSGPRAVLVDGRPPRDGDGWGRPDGPTRLRVGESGTAARLCTAAFALCGRPPGIGTVQGSGSLDRRSSPPLFTALRGAGVELREEGPPGGWPVAVTPAPPRGEVVLDDPVSSQEVTALLIALAAHPGERRLEVTGRIPSRPYVALTRAVLATFGVGVEVEQRPARAAFVVSGPLRAPDEPVVVEPDASAAAVALAAAALTGGEAWVRGLSHGSPQGDVRIVDRLAAFGVDAGERGGALWATGRPTRGARLDLSGEPDLAPVLAAVAGAAAHAGRGESRLDGLGTLPGKESSRIAVLARGLEALGLTVQATDESLSIAPGRGGSVTVELDPAGDHRMAFAFALLSLVREGVRVREPACVAKSWPGFWEDLERAGATLH